MNKKRTLACLVLLPLLAVALAATQMWVRTASSQAVAQDQAVSETVSVLDTPAGSRDDVSTWRVTAAEKSRGNARKLDFTSARVVYADAARTVAVIRAQSGLCLLTQTENGAGGLNCSPNAASFPDNLNYGESIGIVPDSVQTVTFTMADGRRESVPVVRNLWKAPAEASSAAFNVAGSVRRVELMPLSSLPVGSRVSASGVVMSGARPSELNGFNP